MTDGLRIVSDKRVLRIVFDDSAARNLLRAEWLAELSAIASRLADDPLLQVVTITGAGLEWFSAGILTPDLRTSLGKAGVLDVVRLANRTFDAIGALAALLDDGKGIGEALARMVSIGQAIDDGDSRGTGKFFDERVVKGAHHDAMDIGTQDTRDISDRLA